MTLHWTDLAFILAIVGSGCTAAYFLLMHSIRLTVLDRQRELERRVTMIAEMMRNLERRLDEQRPSSESAAQDQVQELLGAADPAHRQEEIPAEIQVAIAAAAVAVLGRDARVLSARLARPREVVSPWSQQGRVSVQASHNLRLRR